VGHSTKEGKDSNEAFYTCPGHEGRHEGFMGHGDHGKKRRKVNG